jgi:hypothetical protein
MYVPPPLVKRVLLVGHHLEAARIQRLIEVFHGVWFSRVHKVRVIDFPGCHAVELGLRPANLLAITRDLVPILVHRGQIATAAPPHTSDATWSKTSTFRH